MIRSDPTGTSLHYLHFHIFFIAICGWMPRVADKQPGNDDVYFAFNLGVDQPNIFSMILFLFVLLFFSHFGIPSFLFFINFHSYIQPIRSITRNPNLKLLLRSKSKSLPLSQRLNWKPFNSSYPKYLLTKPPRPTSMFRMLHIGTI